MDKKEILKDLRGIPEDVYDMIVLTFYEETRGHLKELALAVEASNWTAIRSLAHGIKGSAANLRLFQIQHAAQSLQDASKLNDHEQVVKLFELLKSLVADAGMT